MEKSFPNSILLVNLLPYMTKKFFENFFMFEIKGVTTKSITIITCKGIPDKALIVFSNEKGMESFLKEHTAKIYLGTNNKFEIKENFSSEDMEIEVDNRKIFDFSVKYNELTSFSYEKNIKDEGLIFTDERVLNEQSKVIKFLLKKLGANLMKGESVMNISLPVTIFDKRTLLQL